MSLLPVQNILIISIFTLLYGVYTKFGIEPFLSVCQIDIMKLFSNSIIEMKLRCNDNF